MASDKNQKATDPELIAERMMERTRAARADAATPRDTIVMRAFALAIYCMTQLAKPVLREQRPLEPDEVAPMLASIVGPFVAAIEVVMVEAGLARDAATDAAVDVLMSEYRMTDASARQFIADAQRDAPQKPRLH